MSRARAPALVGSLVAALAGCATTPVSYLPRIGGNADPSTTVLRGVGLAAVRDASHTISVAPTFRSQSAERPTFTVRYTNASAARAELAPQAIRVFFRGEPVALYTRAERLDELRADERWRDVAQVIVGTVAVAAALWGIYAGPTWLHGATIGGGSGLQVQLHAPIDGVLVGIAIAAAADDGIRQLAWDASSDARASGSILEARSVAPGQTAWGQIVVRNCCDPRLRLDDILRIEATLHGVTTAFEFQRVAADDPTALPGR